MNFSSPSSSSLPVVSDHFRHMTDEEAAYWSARRQTRLACLQIMKSQKLPNG
jgi:hypothetical protein